MRQSLQTLINQVTTQAEALAAQNQLLKEIGARIDANNAELRDTIRGSLLQRIAEAQLWLEKISTENQSAFAHLDGSITGTRGDIGGLANQIAEVRLWLEKISTETNNRLTHLHGSTVTEFNRLFNEALPQVNIQSHVAAALLLDARARGVDRGRWNASELERYQNAKKEDFDRTLAQVAADFPSVARAWRERLDAVSSAFTITKAGNAASAADLYSQMFKSFVEYHVNGRVLDVGCGVFGRPFYLSTYPAKLISGIEPLEMIEAPDFECVRGISEYLPWRDDAFSTVINATSLDHVASLEKSLAEISRVLRPDGTLLLWIGSMKGSPEFKPDSPQFVPADQFHLFHFDTAWFEPMLAAQWEIVERMEFATPSFDHLFYALRSTKRG